MPYKRLSYKLAALMAFLRVKIRSIGLNLNYIFVSFIFLLVIILLSINIYKIVRRAEDNYAVKLEEGAKRDEILGESKILDEELSYLQSPDAKREMALEGFKLAEEGEQLYVVDRKDIDYDYIEEQNISTVNLDDNYHWWKFVLFGVN